VVTTAPVHVLTPEPTDDTGRLRQLIHDVSAADLAGNLSMAYRIGRTLLGREPAETLVLTDEPLPEEALDGVEFRTFGKPLPNVAIVGLDASQPLCHPSDPTDGEEHASEPRIVVTVQNFSDIEQEIRLVVTHRGRSIQRLSQRLEPGARTPISFTIPKDLSGLIEVELAAKQDALAVDNRLVLALPGTATVSAVVASHDPAFLKTIGPWLDACPRIAWRPAEAADAVPVPDVVITDHADETPASAVGTLVVVRHEVSGSEVDPAKRAPAVAGGGMSPPRPDPSASRGGHAKRGTRGTTGLPALYQNGTGPGGLHAPGLETTRWFVELTHPISEYLQSLTTVATAVEPSASEDVVGHPVLWGVVGHRKIPLVSVEERGGHRVVRLFLDPTKTPTSTPLILVFFNSLRWLTSAEVSVTTGEPLSVGPLAQGMVRVERPDGSMEERAHQGGLLSYHTTDQAGRYRFIQHRTALDRAVNFLDPLESNTMRRVSTWDAPADSEAVSDGQAITRTSLVPWLLMAVVLLLVAEWWLYIFRGRGGVR